MGLFINKIVSLVEPCLNHSSYITNDDIHHEDEK